LVGGSSMRFKRQEPFRYQFGQPIPCTFRITRIGDREVKTDKGLAEIHDISPRGVRIETHLNIPVDPERRPIEIEISFVLVEEEIRVRGIFVWKKPFAKEYQYGVNLTISEDQKEKLISEIKKFAAVNGKK
jgi:hypothetical protein